MENRLLFVSVARFTMYYFSHLWIAQVHMDLGVLPPAFLIARSCTESGYAVIKILTGILPAILMYSTVPFA